MIYCRTTAVRIVYGHARACVSAKLFFFLWLHVIYLLHDIRVYDIAGCIVYHHEIFLRGRVATASHACARKKIEKSAS